MKDVLSVPSLEDLTLCFCLRKHKRCLAPADPVPAYLSSLDWRVLDREADALPPLRRVRLVVTAKTIMWCPHQCYREAMAPEQYDIIRPLLPLRVRDVVGFEENNKAAVSFAGYMPSGWTEQRSGYFTLVR